MDGKINIDDLITHTMSLDEINCAFDLMHEGKSIRSVITLKRLGARQMKTILPLRSQMRSSCTKLKVRVALLSGGRALPRALSPIISVEVREMSIPLQLSNVPR